MSSIQSNSRITPFLWYDGQAEEAIKLYVSLFPNSEIINLKYWETGMGFPENWINMGEFVLDGLRLSAFDAGPQFKFNESISLFVTCKTQDEIDHYWNGFLDDGGVESECGWLKDRFGLSWQIVPVYFADKLREGEATRSKNMVQAMYKMKKMDLAKLKAAYES